MGIKEDGLPTRYVFGYSGQLRPLQTVAGKCEVCKEDVWIDYQKPSKEYLKTLQVHYGCEPFDWLCICGHMRSNHADTIEEPCASDECKLCECLTFEPLIKSGEEGRAWEQTKWPISKWKMARVRRER
jgi:hypothetical protein